MGPPAAALPVLQELGGHLGQSGGAYRRRTSHDEGIGVKVTIFVFGESRNICF